MNDLEISYNNAPALFKYADDSTMVSPVSNQCDPSANLVGQFMTWSKDNNMSCNPKKCKELIFRSKGNNSQYNPVFEISQCSSLVLLRVTIQSDCKFRAHVNLNLIKANKCIHVLRTLRKEKYSQAEIDHLITVLVSPNFIYGLPVYGASEPDLNIIQNILDRCHKRRFISYPVSIKDLLKNQDCKIFKKVTSINNHPLASYYIISKKVFSDNLRKKQCARPKLKLINTERFISAFVNRLIFKHNLSTG